MVETKNILIIGKIKGGKSALANVLSGTEVFEENSSSLTENWRAKDKEFEIEDKDNEEMKVKYRVIDTVGLGDKKLTNKVLLAAKFEEEVGTHIDEGISQIFFVIGERLDEKILEEFSYLNKSLFENKALDCTTIVSTNFRSFKKEEKCEEETNKLTNLFNSFVERKVESKEFYEEISNKVLKKGKVIYVDNPPLNIKGGDKVLKEIELNKNRRKKSREILLDCLDNLNDKKIYQSDLRRWLDKNYPFKGERKEMLVLNVSKQNLKGILRLKGFINLKRLNCSDNQLTSLDLSDCSGLIELKCNNNQLANLNFLKSVGNLEKLEIQDNKNLSPRSLKIFENLDKLEELNINNTNNISEGWECLLKSCQKLYCNSENILEELDKKICLERVKDEKQYYNFDTWRKIDKQNKITADVIPLERFFVIRNNIKKFIDRWGTREKSEDNSHWYTNYFNYVQTPFNRLSKLWVKTEESNLTELSKIQSPAQYEKNWYWTVPQWGGRSVVGISGVLGISGKLSFGDHQIGAIAVVSPIVEIITSYAKKNWYEDKEKQWAEFTQDTKELLDNYHELLGILKTIRSSELGQLNKVLGKLKKTTEEFLNEYDNDKNGVISILELKVNKNKEKLSNDLNNENKWAGGSKLGRIVRLMKMLEEKINAYIQKKPLKETSLNDKKQELAWVIIDSLTEYSNSELNIEEKYNEKGKNNWNWKANWINYLKDITTTKDFEKQRQNLLYLLVEMMTEQLNKFDIEELFANHEKNKELLNEFTKKVQIICKIRRKLKNEELCNILSSLEDKNEKFLSHLEKRSDNVVENTTVITIEEEERNLDEIIKVIKKMEEKVKTCHETLVAQIEQ